MGRFGLKCAGGTIFLLLLAFSGASAIGSDYLGNDPEVPADTVVCPVPGNATEAFCTEIQMRPGGRNAFDGWFDADSSGVITALQAAKRAVVKGGHPSVRVTVNATDASGNQIQREMRVRWKEG
jgi:hypothetical protein